MTLDHPLGCEKYFDLFSQVSHVARLLRARRGVRIERNYKGGCELSPSTIRASFGQNLSILVVDEHMSHIDLCRSAFRHTSGDWGEWVRHKQATLGCVKVDDTKLPRTLRRIRQV